MGYEISEEQIGKIVKQIVSEMTANEAPKSSWDSTQYRGRKLIGIYSDMNDAIEAANAGYKAIRSMSVEQRERMITEIRRLTRLEAPIMAELGVAETGMGRVDHKTAKHILVAEKTPGTEDIVSEAKTGDDAQCN